MKHLTLLSMGVLLSLNLFAQSLVEKPIVNTSFAEWRTLTHVSDNAAAPDSTRQLVTKKSGETITFTFHQTNLFDGGTGKVSGACDAGSRYVCGMKNAEDNPATLTTSAFASVTKISFTACVSGSNRGWGVRVKGDGDEDWVVVYNTLLPNTNRTDITVNVNRTNVQIQWYNLVPKQYTTFSNLKVYGMVEDDGMSEINYFDLNGKLIGTQTVTTGSTFVPLYGAADLVIPEGMAFRGWNENGVRIDETQVIDHDMDLRAYASAIETAQTGSYYSYNLSQPNFYPQDHDLLDYHSAQEIGITVSSKVYVAYTTSDNTAHPATYYADQDVVVVSCEEPLSIKSIEVYNVKSPIGKAGKHYSVAGGDAASFLMVVNQLEDGDTVYLANGQYDLGERVLTTIARNNIVIMGESMDGVIIRNTPPMAVEGINTTATIFNTGTGNRYENLTLHNALDYYTSIAKTNSGRAVCLQDKGNKTVCYRVRMLSYQDTYYSNHIGAQHYFEECEIHGTVDFVCGDGSVYFYNCLLYCEPRKADGSGTDCITASNASAGDKGYVFDRCTIQSKCPVISLGRAWNNAPKCAYLLTTLDYTEGNFSLNDSKIQRWTKDGMNSNPDCFMEYNTMNTDGEVISPEENVVSFVYNNVTKPMNTIVWYDTAKTLIYPSFFTNWDPAVNYVPFPEGTDLKNIPADIMSQGKKKIMLNNRLYIRNGRGAYVSVLGL